MNFEVITRKSSSQFDRSLHILSSMLLLITLVSCNDVHKVGSNKYENVLLSDSIDNFSFLEMKYNAERVFIYKIDWNLKHDTIGFFGSSTRGELEDQFMGSWNFLGYDTTIGWFIDYEKGGQFETFYVSDTFLMLHPPRFSKFRESQFWPYPFFFSNKRYWNWDLEIGKVWRVPERYEITSKINFKYNFSTVALEKNQVNSDSLIITAESKSTFGSANAVYKFARRLGLVNAKITNHFNEDIALTIIEAEDDHKDLWSKNAPFVTYLQNYWKHYLRK